MFAGQWWVVVMFVVCCVGWRGKICSLGESSIGTKMGSKRCWYYQFLTLNNANSAAAARRGKRKKHNEKAMTKTYERARGKVQTSNFFSLSPKLLQYFKWKHVNLLAFDDWEKSSSEMFCFPARELNKHTTHMRADDVGFFFVSQLSDSLQSPVNVKSETCELSTRQKERNCQPQLSSAPFYCVHKRALT